MARKSTKINHKQLNDNAYGDKYNENVSYLPKATIVFEHDIGSVCRYIGGIHVKGSLCTITKQVESKSKLYYSVIFEGTNKEVNWIMAHLLQKYTHNTDNAIESEDMTNE